MSTYTPLPQPRDNPSITQAQHVADVSIDQLCRMCAVHTDYILELVQEGVIVPAAMVGNSDTPEAWHAWRFASLHVRRTKVASRLQRDLGVNLAGAALALQLLDELETLRAQVVVLTVIDR
jgi:chaperone modulatory protein CbpM